MLTTSELTWNDQLAQSRNDGHLCSEQIRSHRQRDGRIAQQRLADERAQLLSAATSHRYIRALPGEGMIGGLQQ